MKKKIRYILFPFAIIYGLVVDIRNFLFDRNILHSVEFDLPVIGVGNLSTGGTGKTPMVEYLIELLRPAFKVATLSRGYKRKTKGFILAGEHTGAEDIGDEPMLFFMKYEDISVAVSEDRLVAIPQILHLKPETRVVILDDAFQHRSVRAGLNILLTSFSDRYTHDHLLPVGSLRDSRRSSERTGIIIVTKCRADLTVSEKEDLIKELKPATRQKVFFTALQYGTPYHLFGKQEVVPGGSATVLLVAGIADPAPLLDFLKDKVQNIRLLAFGDHHSFVPENIRKIKKLFTEIGDGDKMIITTEKDAAKLLKYRRELSGLPVYVIPVRHSFLFEEDVMFRKMIFDFVQ